MLNIFPCAYWTSVRPLWRSVYSGYLPIFKLNSLFLFGIELYKFFFCFLKIFIVIQLQLYAFSPHPSTSPQPNPPPSPTSTLPLDLVHVSFTVVPVIPSPHCPLPTPPPAIVRLFLASMSLVIFCLLFSSVDEGGGFGWGEVEGWGEKAYNCN